MATVLLRTVSRHLLPEPLHGFARLPFFYPRGFRVAHEVVLLTQDPERRGICALVEHDVPAVPIDVLEAADQINGGVDPRRRSIRGILSPGDFASSDCQKPFTNHGPSAFT
jgi:hypothetical protein